MRMGKRLYSLLMFLAVSVLGGLLLAGLAVPVTGLAASTGKIAADSMNQVPEELEVPPQPERSIALLADGSTLASFYDQNRVFVKLDQISPSMRMAQVAIEDTRFYKHGAVDLTGTVRALVRTTSGNTQGASTLTQQYVKLVLIQKAQADGDTAAMAAITSRTMSEKIREIRYAVALEQKLSKDQILENYLNMAYYGDGAYGVEAAAKHYFGVSAKDLDLAQSAMLAGVVRNPVTTDPVHHPLVAVERRNNVVDRIGELAAAGSTDVPGIAAIKPDAIAAAKAEKWDASKVQVSQGGCVSASLPLVCRYLEKLLVQSPSLGATPNDRHNLLYRGGLVIKTSIDTRIQEASQDAISRYIKPGDPVISLSITMQPGTGLITSMAQSRPQMTGDGGTWYNYAVPLSQGGYSGFQGGSTFKAYTTAAALAMGMPISRSYDVQKSWQFQGERFPGGCSGTIVQRSSWIVDSDRQGPMDMLTGAGASVNGYFVALEQDVGICNVVKMAQTLGLKAATNTDLKKYGDNPSFTLGTVEISPLSQVEAYGTFAARGMHCTPILITEIKTKAGQALAAPAANCSQVISQDVADRVNVVLQQPYKGGGTAESARPSGNWDIAGKTGTENGVLAIWCMGYTPEVVAAGMIAEDRDPKYSSIWANRGSYGLGGWHLQSGYTLKGSSGSEAGGLIMKPALQAALEGKPNTQFVVPGAQQAAQKVAVPSCNSVASCKAALQAAGFAGVVRSTPNDQPPGTFLGISPRGMAPQFSTIYISVSGGPEQPAPAAPAPVAPAPVATG